MVKNYISSNIKRFLISPAVNLTTSAWRDCISGDFNNLSWVRPWKKCLKVLSDRHYQCAFRPLVLCGNGDNLGLLNGIDAHLTLSVYFWLLTCGTIFRERNTAAWCKLYDQQDRLFYLPRLQRPYKCTSDALWNWCGTGISMWAYSYKLFDNHSGLVNGATILFSK
jgi:hypothetical protein